MTTDQLTRQNLRNFTGSDRSVYNPLFRRFSYTQGVKFVSDNGAAWLIVDILSHLIHNKKVNREDFVNITLKVNMDRTTILTFEDGNDNILDQQVYPMTDFPLPEIQFFATNNMLLLTSEY